MERKPEVPASTRDEALFIAPNPVDSRQAPPKSTVSLTSQRQTEKLPEVTGRSRGTPGFPAATQEILESLSSTCLEALVTYHDARAMTRSPSGRAWRPDFPGTTREAPLAPVVPREKPQTGNTARENP